MIIHRLNENLIIILIFYSFLFILILFIDYIKNIFLKISSSILLILSNTFSLFHSLFTIINHKNFAYLHLYSHFSVPSSTSIVKDKEISGFDNVVAKGKQFAFYEIANILYAKIYQLWNVKYKILWIIFYKL